MLSIAKKPSDCAEKSTDNEDFSDGLDFLDDLDRNSSVISDDEIADSFTVTRSKKVTAQDARVAARVAALVVPKWSKKVTKAPHKKVTKRVRRSDKKDKEAIETLDKLKTAALSGSPLTVRISSPPISASSAIKTPSARSALSLSTPSKLPAWEHTDDRLKITMANQIIAGCGGVAFSLNLSEDEIALAHAHPKGFVDYFKRKLDRWCLRYLGGKRWYWFCVDVNDKGRLHLHGAIEFPNQHLEDLENVMRVVGGLDWKPGLKKSERQIDTKPMWGPDGWVTYDLKYKGKVKKLIKGPIFTIAGIRGLSESRYNHLRAGRL